MCGVLGYYAFGPKRPFYPALFYSWNWLKARGTDGCGFAYPHPDGKIVSVKSELASDKFLVDPSAKEALDQLVACAPPYIIMHVRKSTVLNRIDTIHAHPFMSENVIAIHNGRISNADELMRGMKKSMPIVDSEAIPHVFEKYAIWESADKFTQALEQLRGEFTIAALTAHDQKLYLASNGGRPLSLTYDEDTNILYFCSEHAYLEDMFYANGTDKVALGDLHFTRSWSYPTNRDPLVLESKDRKWYIISPPEVGESLEQWVTSGSFREFKEYGGSSHHPPTPPKPGVSPKTPEVSILPKSEEKLTTLIKETDKRVANFLQFVGVTPASA